VPRTVYPIATFVTDSLSHSGGRDVNEDCCDYAATGQTACWVVADGLGGHRGGRAASSTVVEAVLTSFRANPECSADAIAAHVEAAQAALQTRQRAEPALAGMRSTIVVMITDFDRMCWGHVGDSRLYYLDDRGLTRCTEDHSVAQAMASAGRISDEEARHHPDRARLLRSLGDDEGWRPTIARDPQPIYRGAAVLLCTDGFWEYLTDTEMVFELAKSATPADWLAGMERRLLERAPEGCDNYTAVAAFFPGVSVPPPERSSFPTDSRRRMSTRLTLLIAFCIGATVAALLSATMGLKPLREWSQALFGGRNAGVPARTVDRPAPAANRDRK